MVRMMLSRVEEPLRILRFAVVSSQPSCWKMETGADDAAGFCAGLGVGDDVGFGVGNAVGFGVGDGVGVAYGQTPSGCWCAERP